jgi:hypothetical protein
MDHAHIQAHDVTVRYATGRLTADEERDFEAHLLDCPQCVEDVECETGLREGLRAIAHEPAFARPAPARRAIWRAPVMSGFLAAAAAILLVASISLGVSLSRSSAALQTARAERDSLAGQAARAEQSADASRQQLADAQRRAADTPSPTAPPTAAAPAPLTAPAAVAPASIFALTSVRDGSTASAPPINRVTVSPDAGLVVFSLDLPDPSSRAQYRVTLTDRAGRVQWTGGPYRATTPDVLAVAVESRLLPAGDYTLELQQQAGAARPSLVGRYPLRVIAQ